MKNNVNVVAVLNASKNKLLMCKRGNNPYKGLLNLVGGKIEPNEDSLNAAYRELFEETSITENDIKLLYLMDFNYNLFDIRLEAYFGVLNKDISVHGDENELIWIELNEDFFDMKRFAGEGNIGHIMAHVKSYYHI
jgi:ADP-ribose pyrophosphatase